MGWHAIIIIWYMLEQSIKYKSPIEWTIWVQCYSGFKKLRNNQNFKNITDSSWKCKKKVWGNFLD